MIMTDIRCFYVVIIIVVVEIALEHVCDIHHHLRSSFWFIFSSIINYVMALKHMFFRLRCRMDSFQYKLAVKRICGRNL